MKHPFFRLTVILLVILLICMTLPGCAPKSAPAATLNVEEELLRAETLFQQGNYEETILALTAVIEVEPADARGYLRLSDVYIARGEKEKALELLEKGLELTGNEEINQRIKGMTQPVVGVRQISGEWNYTLILMENGDVYFTGEAPSYDNQTLNSLSPTKIEGIREVVQVDANSESLLLTKSGELYAWRDFMHIDVPSDHDLSKPVKLMGDVKNFTSVKYAVFVIKTDGTLYSFGLNADCQLGRGLPYREDDYGDVAGMIGSSDMFEIGKVLDDVVCVAGQEGGYAEEQSAACFAVTRTGELYYWGTYYTDDEQPLRVCVNRPVYLRDGVRLVDTTSDRVYIVDVTGELEYLSLRDIASGIFEFTPVTFSESRITQISCGLNHMVALDEDGVVYSTGINTSGQLGVDEKNTYYDQVFIPLKGVKAIGIGTGELQSFAITEQKSMLAWGDNLSGQLGNGRKGEQHDTAEPSFVMGDVQQVFAEDMKSFALLKDGRLFAFGNASLGSLGTGNNNPVRAPQEVFSGIKYVGMSELCSYLITDDNVLYISGSSPVSSQPQSEYTALMQNVSFVEANLDSLFVVKTDGSLWACGPNLSGELGLGTRNEDGAAPVNELTKVMDGVKKVSTGSVPEHCATYILKTDGTVLMCGFDPIAVQYVLEPVVIAKDVTDLAMGSEFSTTFSGTGRYDQRAEWYNAAWLLDRSNTLSVWGVCNSQFFARDVLDDVIAPKPLRVMDGIKKIEAARSGNVAAIDFEGNLLVFGREIYEDLFGNEGWSAQRGWPQDTLVYKNMMKDVEDAAVGSGHCLAVTTDGNLYSWGDNQYGQLGLGDAGTDENIFEIKLPG